MWTGNRFGLQGRYLLNPHRYYKRLYHLSIQMKKCLKISICSSVLNQSVTFPRGPCNYGNQNLKLRCVLWKHWREVVPSLLSIWEMLSGCLRPIGCSIDESCLIVSPCSRLQRQSLGRSSDGINMGTSREQLNHAEFINIYVASYGSSSGDCQFNGQSLAQSPPKLYTFVTYV